MRRVDPGTLAHSYHLAEQVTASWARSFHFASRFLPHHKQRAIYALYDYCRHADNLVDLRGQREPADVRAELAELRDEIRHIHAGGDPPARWVALADTLRRYPVPLAPLLELLDGVAMDLDHVELTTWADLQAYCRLVAGGVGLMLGPVLGAREEGFSEPGVRLGVAMQLTNVLRDLGEDLDRGRVYLPAEELAEFGLDRAALEQRRVTPAFRQLMRFQVERARRYFSAGDAVIALFPHDGSRLTVRLLQRTYAGILDVIESAGYDVFRRRAYVSGARKLLILGRAMASERAALTWAPRERSV